MNTEVTLHDVHASIAEEAAVSKTLEKTDKAKVGLGIMLPNLEPLFETESLDDCDPEDVEDALERLIKSAKAYLDLLHARMNLMQASNAVDRLDPNNPF